MTAYRVQWCCVLQIPFSVDHSHVVWKHHNPRLAICEFSVFVWLVLTTVPVDSHIQSLVFLPRHRGTVSHRFWDLVQLSISNPTQDGREGTLPETNIQLMEEIRPTSWYGKYSAIYRVSFMSGGAGFLPSTVAPENGLFEYDRFLLGWTIFRRCVSFRECDYHNLRTTVGN